MPLVDFTERRSTGRCCRMRQGHPAIGDSEGRA